MSVSTVRRVDAFDTARTATHRVAAIATLNILVRLRDPGQVISYIAMPMVMMVMLKPLYARGIAGGTAQVVTGLLVVFSVLAMSVAGNSILVERHWQTWERLRTTRAASVELLLGKTIPVFVILFVQQFVLLAYGCVVIGLPVPRSLGYVTLAIAVWAFTLLAVGTAFAAVARSLGDFSTFTKIGALTFASLGGAMVPLGLLPGWVATAALVSPGFWAMRMMQAAIRGDALGVLGPAGILLALGLVAGKVAIGRLSRGWGRARLL